MSFGWRRCSVKDTVVNISGSDLEKVVQLIADGISASLNIHGLLMCSWCVCVSCFARNVGSWTALLGDVVASSSRRAWRTSPRPSWARTLFATSRSIATSPRARARPCVVVVVGCCARTTCEFAVCGCVLFVQEAIEALTALIDSHRGLQYLHLAGDGKKLYFGLQMKGLFASFARNQCLVELDISGNNLGDKVRLRIGNVGLPVVVDWLVWFCRLCCAGHHGVL